MSAEWLVRLTVWLRVARTWRAVYPCAPGSKMRILGRVEYPVPVCTSGPTHVLMNACNVVRVKLSPLVVPRDKELGRRLVFVTTEFDVGVAAAERTSQSTHYLSLSPAHVHAPILLAPCAMRLMRLKLNPESMNLAACMCMRVQRPPCGLGLDSKLGWRLVAHSCSSSGSGFTRAPVPSPRGERGRSSSHRLSHWRVISSPVSPVEITLPGRKLNTTKHHAYHAHVGSGARVVHCLET